MKGWRRQQAAIERHGLPPVPSWPAPVIPPEVVQAQRAAEDTDTIMYAVDELGEITPEQYALLLDRARERGALRYPTLSTHRRGDPAPSQDADHAPDSPPKRQ